MVFPTLLPRVDESTSTQLLSALARIGPLLVNPSNARSIAERLDLDAEWFVECDTVEQVEDALNGPAGKVIVGEEVIGSIGDEFKRDVIVRLSTIQGKEDQLDGLAGVVLPSSSSIDATQIKSIRKRLVAPGLILIESETTTTTTPSADLIPLIPSSSLTPESIAKLFISNLTSDRPDGLYPTIVSTPSSSPSPALGLVYSSGESITESIITGKGVYQSRKHGLWRKGETSGSTQKVIRIRKDCDQDALVFEVEQTGTGFCHLETRGCFSLDAGRTDEKRGLEALEQTLRSRLTDAPPGSYTSRLFNDPKLLSQKIMEEAEELVDAADSDRSHVAFEMADLLYFAMVKCVKAGVSLKDVERNLDEKAAKGKKGIRRTGDAKSKWVEYGRAKEEQAAAGKAGDKILGVQTVETVGKDEVDEVPVEQVVKAESKPDAPVPKAFPTSADDGAAVANGDAQAEMIRMRTSDLGSVSREERQELLKRPVMDSSAMIERVKPIVSKVREGGDQALKALTKQFDRSDLDSNVLLPPFYPPPGGQELSTKITDAIEQAYANVKAFHEGQAEKEPLVVETMPGVVCTRFARPIDRVGIYVPGGTAILPSTALMLGVPAQVAGCSTIVLATPPRPDGSISPEVLYVAKLVGVDVILKAGGAQAVAAMAYGTETCPKVDKIFGPGNQWVTAAKMLVQNDTQALVGIDMPAGPSEVMVSRSRASSSRQVAVGKLTA
jgi:phosphoribosyl-ATP pyrophosphohydrolase/phosphoribosyl-AMP cyclohydrolase/histidinol dehydrogenase